MAPAAQRRDDRAERPARRARRRGQRRRHPAGRPAGLAVGPGGGALTCLGDGAVTVRPYTCRTG
ncbi:hypothetical protein [Ornithinimicrobium kibberense]|uniref:hypothetical protein n=1 Tax=Ornithinimicrobium kibberense TaxID=282060 RepID=UPI003610643D